MLINKMLLLILNKSNSIQNRYFEHTGNKETDTNMKRGNFIIYMIHKYSFITPSLPV